MCSLVPLVTMMFPKASTVPGWQLAQLVSGIAGVCAASLGGMPWQLPHDTCPVDVHTGRPSPWQDALAHVWVVRSQPRLAVTSAGAGVSMWPTESVAVGTRWHVAQGTGAEMRDEPRRCAWCAPTPIAVVYWLPSRSLGGAGELALPWQLLHAVPTCTTPSMCGAVGE